MKGKNINTHNSIGKLLEENILYEDNHIIIVNKLPSQIVQGDKTGDIPLSDLVKDYIKKKYNKSGFELSVSSTDVNPKNTTKSTKISCHLPIF